MPEVKRRILFVCTGNTCRSPMAAVIFEQMAKNGRLPVSVASAGVAVAPGSPASPVAQRVLARHNIDLVDHSASDVYRMDITPHDLIFTMTRRHRDMLIKARPELAGQTHILKEYVDAESSLDVKDPFGGSDADYEACYAELSQLLQKLYDKLYDKLLEKH